MGGRRMTRRLLVEGLKLLLLTVVFFAIQQEIFRIRFDLYGNRSRVAEAQARYRGELDQVRDELSDTLDTCLADFDQTRRQLEDSVARLTEENQALRVQLYETTRQLEDSVIGRLESKSRQWDLARAALVERSERLEDLGRLVASDPEPMKRKMILTTVQLRGNGTVGSGVIVYSEPQPDIALGDDTPSTTFVLTAYHVVVEVLGERLERGLLDDVRVLLESEPDTTRTYSARLVLFDRTRDTALLRLNSTERFPNVATLKSRSELKDVDVFTRAYAVGCPLGNRPLPTLGEISSVSKRVGDQEFWMLSAPTFFGNSGGGVYLASTSELIGISSMIYTYGKTHPAVVPHLGLFVPLGEIYEWLDAEGYGFVYQHEPIPRAKLWKLAYLERPRPVPRAAAAEAAEGGGSEPRGPQSP